MVGNESIMFSTFDMFFVSVAVGAAAYYFIFKKNKDEDEDTNMLLPTPTTSFARSDASSSTVEKMKKSNKTVVVFYGSQTGTAEEFSNRLAKDAQRYGLKALVVDPEEFEAAELGAISEIENSLALFCMATYGEGDPTDNAQIMYDFLQEGECDLAGLNYAVFGLGNKTYEHFNSVGKYFDKRLEELGGNRMYQLGIGDDDANIEEDFVTWKDLLWQAIVEKMDIKIDESQANFRQYEYKVVEKDEDMKVFSGEISRIDSYKNQKGPYDVKNPYLAEVSVNRELHKGGDRSCIHVELNITDSKIGYNAGDHVAVYPTNDPDMVAGLAKRLNIDLETVFRMDALDEDSSKRHPFPCPTTFGTALGHYLDLTSPLRTNVLQELAQYCTDDEDKQFLLRITGNTPEGKKEYEEWAMKSRRTLLQALEDVPSCQPDVGHLLELLPRLQARYYSIASSPRKDSNSIHICASVIKYEASKGRINNGVTTKYLSEMTPGTKCPIFVRRSQFHLPFKVSNPVIMIGPGTGLAPFIGFMQDREYHRGTGKEVGDMKLYFGCRKKKEDYIYQEELEKWEEDGLLKELNVAFSRDSSEKVYVQHLLKNNSQSVWDVIGNNGHLYVCGDAKHMARDVQEALTCIIEEKGGKTRQQAQDFVKNLQKRGKYSLDVWS